MKSDVWSLGITMVIPRAWTGTLGLGWGLYWWGSNPATSDGIWWLHPWVDARQTGLNSERDSSRHEMNYPGRRAVLLPCAHRGTSPRGEVAVSRGVLPAVPPLLRLSLSLPGSCQEIIHLLPLFFPPLPSCVFLLDPGGYIKACYPHVGPLYPSAWFHRATCVQCQLQIAPLALSCVGVCGRLQGDNFWMTVDLPGHPRLASNCSAVPHALAGEVVGGAGFAAAGSQPSCTHPPPELAELCGRIGVN